MSDWRPHEPGTPQCAGCQEYLTEDEVMHGEEPRRGRTAARGDQVRDGYGHIGLCCDCFDLTCGMSLERLNGERVRKGRPPLTTCPPFGRVP